jgi:hypothetical protein
MLGGAAVGTPIDPSKMEKNYVLKGSGDLNKDNVDALFPYLLNTIFQNGGECSQVTQISYYVDPLSKILAFMLACPAAAGSNVFQVVYLTEKASYLYMGRTGFLVIPENYWQVKPASASAILT